MKIWKDHPEELAAWRDRALAERKEILQGYVEFGEPEDLDLPYVPNEYTITFTHEEFRKIYSGS